MNQLERHFLLAATDPASRPDLYRMMLQSTLFALTPTAPARQSSRVLQQDETFQLVNWSSGGRQFIPIFTSIERVREALAGHQVHSGYVGMAAMDLFHTLSQLEIGAMLNPGWTHSREFTPSEIRRLAAGNFLDAASQDTVAAGRNILIGNPKEEPTELLDALRKYFSAAPEVRAAYLALVIDPAVSQEPRLLIALRVTGNYHPIVQDAAIIVKEVSAGKSWPPVDFIILDKPGVLGGHFDGRTDPFYVARGA